MIHIGDCRDVMRELAEGGVRVDSVITDPPYELGFMGKQWDKSGVAFDPDTWRLALALLKPGGHLLAFAGARTYHRICCAIEDAGFEIRDQIMWLYGSGFPKSHNLSGERAGWGTALKPAHEPIVFARRPLAGTVAENVQQFGTGAINIDGCRVAGEPWKAHTATGLSSVKFFSEGHAPIIEKHPHQAGRWPANVMHDGSDEVLAAFPEAPGQIADASSSSSSRKTQHIYGAMKRGNAAGAQIARGDTGSAARFFYCAKASRGDRNEGCDAFAEKPLLWSSGTKSPGTFQAEGTKKAAQNNHPTVKPTALMRYLCRLVTPPGGLVLDPFMGSGSTGKATTLEGFDFIGIEREAEYAEIARARIAHAASFPRQRDIFEAVA